jgi:hypothetical protein
MAKATKERVITDVVEQQEIASHEMPISKAVTNARSVYRDPQTGQVGVVGVMDKRQVVQDGRPTDYRYAQRISMIYRRLRSTKTVPVSIINMLPLRLMVNSPLSELSQGVPGCELDQPYAYLTWVNPIIEVSLQEGEKIPLDYNPMMMAEEFMREYATIGGIMLYEGTIEEFEEDERPEKAAVFSEELERGIKWMLAKVKQANDYWNTPQHAQSRDITELHRICATRCMQFKRLGNNKPEWMDTERAVGDLVAPCKSCGAEPAAGAARCRQCGFIIDPIKAFQNQEIDEKHLSLQRLTRAQVVELKISAFVAETADERDERLERGDDMPLSQYEQRQARLAQAAQQPAATA